jgi:hypothetical protein
MEEKLAVVPYTRYSSFYINTSGTDVSMKTTASLAGFEVLKVLCSEMQHRVVH